MNKFQNLILRNPDGTWSGGTNSKDKLHLTSEQKLAFEKKNKSQETGTQTPVQKAKVEARLFWVEVKAAQQEFVATNQAESKEKSPDKWYISSFDIIKWTSLNKKLLVELKTPEKVQEFVDRIDNIWYRAINNMAPWLDPKTAHFMATGINTYFVKMLDMSVKNWESKVEDVFGALKNMNFSSLSFEGILGGMTWLFDKSTLLYNLVKNTTKIAKILRVNKKYIWDGREVTILNDPSKFMELLENQKILALEDKDIYMWKHKIKNWTVATPETSKDWETDQASTASTVATPDIYAEGNVDLIVIFAKSSEVQWSQNISDLKKIYENHGNVLSQDSVKKVVESMNIMADKADQFLPIMDNITVSIDNNWARFLKSIDKIFSNSLLAKLGVNWIPESWKNAINVILGIFGRDYDSIVNGDKQEYDIAEDNNYKWSSFSMDQYSKLTNIYEKAIWDKKWYCLSEVKERFQYLNDGWFVDLPLNMEWASWWWSAKQLWQDLKKYANDKLPKSRQDKKLAAIDLSWSNDNTQNIYNAINSMNGDMFTIIMTWTQNGHALSAYRVDGKIYIYDNTFQNGADINIPGNDKKWRTLEKYISSRDKQYNFDSVMSMQSKFYKESNAEIAKWDNEKNFTSETNKLEIDWQKLTKNEKIALHANASHESKWTFNPIKKQEWWTAIWPIQFDDQRRTDYLAFDWHETMEWFFKFLKQEAEWKEKSAWQKFKSVDDNLEAKTLAFSQYYERPWKPQDNQRLAIAKKLDNDNIYT